MDFASVEKARAAYREKLKSCRIATLIIAAVIAFIGMALTSAGTGEAAFMVLIFFFVFNAVIALVIASLLTGKEAGEYRKAYKAYFIEQNMRKIFTNLDYHHDQGLSRQAVAATGMINTGDVYSSNDFTSGKYKDVDFTQADAHIQTVHTDSDGNTYYTTIFKGRIMLFEFPKKFNFNLELISRKFHPYRIPKSTNGRKMTKIHTESSEFNRIFKIYGEDGFEAFYILDPAFMVKMQAIAEAHKSKILFGFTNNQLVIALNDGNDSFEPPKSRKPLDEQAELNRVSSDLKTITDFVDQLSLDRKLFK